MPHLRIIHVFIALFLSGTEFVIQKPSTVLCTILPFVWHWWWTLFFYKTFSYIWSIVHTLQMFANKHSCSDAYISQAQWDHLKSLCNDGWLVSAHSSCSVTSSNNTAIVLPNKAMHAKFRFSYTQRHDKLTSQYMAHSVCGLACLQISTYTHKIICTYD